MFQDSGEGEGDVFNYDEAISKAKKLGKKESSTVELDSIFFGLRKLINFNEGEDNKITGSFDYKLG